MQGKIIKNISNMYSVLVDDKIYDLIPLKKEIKADPLRFVREHNKRTVINRKFLLDILQAMDSDLVIVYADEECPIGIIGMMNREMLIEGVVAPRICDYIPENPEGFYD